MILNLAVGSGASVLALLVLHAVTFGIGRRIGRYNVVDVAWALGFIAIAAVGAIRGHGEDPRYADMLRDVTVGQVLVTVFLVQGLATWFISLPLQLSAVLGPTLRPLWVVTVAGVLVWLVGLVFEALGDRQLRAFKSDPAHRGVLMDRGLWAWTRHPNYFGDACVWWGLWLVSIASWWSLATALSPLLMNYFLVRVTGARLTEKYMRGRPGFDEYKSRTSFFVPRPPRLPRT